jgi:crotonobetainyl-CoA:carnitine CoA-transferase CaiB-like acyl-CoA transferase
MESLAENAETATRIVADAIGSHTYDECVQALEHTTGAWAPVQDSWDVAGDAALTANGRIVEIVDADGKRQKLVANPVRFDSEPLTLTRAPGFAENTDDVLRELGISDDELIDLKIAGAIT